jgi:hypothetical protein
MAAAETGENAARLGEIGRFSDDLAIERDESVGGEDDGVGMSARHGKAFAKRIPAGDFAQRERVGRKFRNFWGDDLEVITSLA